MFFKQLIKLLFKSLLEIIYPSFCCYCGKFGAYLCPRCFALIKFYPLPLDIKIKNHSLDQLIACAEYAEPVRSLIKKMKYSSVKDIGKILGKMIWQTTNFPKINLITAVPLHSNRKKKRGFNQAEVIAKELARLSTTAYGQTLIRTINNKNQAVIKDKTERLRNLKNIFQIAPNYQKNQKGAPSNNNSQHNLNKILPPKILIIDDVATTGTTLNECALVLKKYGVQEVTGLVIAHGS